MTLPSVSTVEPFPNPAPAKELCKDGRLFGSNEVVLNGMVRRFPSGVRVVDRRHSMEIHTLGIDIGKTVFNVVGLSPQGDIVVRKKFSRKQLLHFTSNLHAGLIGMEACGGSHFLGRALRAQGHEVRLIPP
jgi:hypothetical protein